MAPRNRWVRCLQSAHFIDIRRWRVTTYTYTLYPSANTQVATTPVTTSTLAQGGTSFTTSTTNLWKRVTYDGFGRTIKVENGHDSNVVDNTVDTVYGACGCSPLGKVVKVSMPYGPGETEVWTTVTTMTPTAGTTPTRAPTATPWWRPWDLPA